MLRFFALAGLPALLAGCAAQPPHIRADARPLPAGARGTVVAVRAVPGTAPQPVQLLFDRLGAVTPLRGVTEFIVRTDAGDTVAVVQPTTSGLHPGDRVDIRRGVQTRIDPVTGSDRT